MTMPMNEWGSPSESATELVWLRMEIERLYREMERCVCLLMPNPEPEFETEPESDRWQLTSGTV